MQYHRSTGGVVGGRCFVYRASVTHLDKNIELNQDQIGWLSRGPVAEMLEHEWMSAMHRGMAAVGAHARTQRLHMCLETPSTIQRATFYYSNIPRVMFAQTRPPSPQST